MNKDTRNMLKYLKEDEQVEVPSYESFRNQILNDLEMYYEDLANEDGDVFADTQDSYANEMVEQHLFDTLLYNIKHNYMSKDAAMQTANDLVYYILDFVDHGEEITLQNDKVIKEVYDKYVLDRKDESMNESVEPKWFKDKKLYNKFKSFVDKQLKDGAIDDPEYIKTLSPEEYESLLVDTWMKDQDEIDMFEEHIKSGYYGEDAMKATIDLMKHHSIVKSIPNYILNAKSQLEKENEYYLQKEPDIRFAYENFLTDLEEIYNRAVEFQNLVIGRQGDTNEENN